MTITRTISGTEVAIELTPEEERKIYWKVQEDYDIEDICSRYNVPEEDRHALAEEFRDALGCNDYFWESYWDTVEYICTQRGYSAKEEE